MRRWIQNDVSNFEWERNCRILKIAQRIEIRKYKKDFALKYFRKRGQQNDKEVGER